MKDKLLVKNISLIDVNRKEIIRRCNILIRDGRFSRIFQGDPDDSAADLDVIDGAGKFALPGMIDTHVHIKARRYSAPSKENPISKIQDREDAEEKWIRKLHSYLYSGVTSIYDAGNIAEMIHHFRKASLNEEIMSPRIFCTGNLVTAPGGHGFEVGCEIESMPADEEKLERFLNTEPDLVKITYDEHGWGIRPLIPILSKDTLKSIIDFCHQRDYRVTVHVSNELRSREALEAGADVLAHTVIQSPVTEDYVKIVSDSGIPVVTTLQIGEGYSRLVNEPEYLDSKLYRDCLEDEERNFLLNSERERLSSNTWTKWMEIMTPVVQENLFRLHKGGAIVSTGTDGTSGPDFHRELKLLKDAGLSELEVLACATINGARVLGKESELGSIEEGKIADLIILESDPTMDLENLLDIEQLIKDGKKIDRSKLDLPVNRK